MEPRTHTVLALDLATNVGWCIGRDNQILVSGVKGFYKKDAHPGRKFRDFHNWLLQFAKVDEIFFENVPHYESMHAAKVYCGFLAIMQTFAEDAGIKCTGIYPTSVKKIFCGKGRADKMKICEHAHNLGWPGGKRGTDQCHDEADACAIYYAIMSKRGIEVTFAHHLA